MRFPPSTVEPITLRGRTIHVKRDDLIDPRYSGNKFRKLHALFDIPADAYRRLISWGGNQSNAMLSIAALCAEQGWRFEYTTKRMPERLHAKPAGNLAAALDFGMVLNEVAAGDYEDAVAGLRSNSDSDTLVLAQGGADALARIGIERLAGEIRDWREAAGIERLHVVTPAGTGTTAAYLALSLPECRVITTPAVADTDDLKRQIERLMQLPANLQILRSARRFRFATPDAELLSIHRELCAAGIEFDLIYGALMWHALLAELDCIEGEILYVHSGGLAGNATMLDRYRHQGLF